MLDYKPNLDALMMILEKINPVLLSHQSFRYKILIAGKRLPVQMNELGDYKDKNIIYTGFVDDIETYLKGADLFLNPVQTGGGIKTKMVEAIGFGTTVIATENGAIGINRSICDEKLVVATDSNWDAFAAAIINTANRRSITPPEYYNYYNWKTIVNNVIKILPNQSSGNFVNH